MGKTVITPFVKALKDLNVLGQNRKGRGYRLNFLF